MFSVILLFWVYDGGIDKFLKRFEFKEMREKIIYDIKYGIEGWDNFIDFVGLDGIYIILVKNKKNENIIGKNLVELGKLKGKDLYNVIFDFLFEEENVVGMVDYYGFEEYIIKLMKLNE